MLLSERLRHCLIWPQYLPLLQHTDTQEQNIAPSETLVRSDRSATGKPQSSVLQLGLQVDAKVLAHE